MSLSPEESRQMTLGPGGLPISSRQNRAPMAHKSSGGKWRMPLTTEQHAENSRRRSSRASLCS